MPEVEEGHHKAIAGKDDTRDKTASLLQPDSSGQRVHENACKNKMQEHGDIVGFKRWDHPEKKPERIKDRRFKVGPERHSPKNIGVPEWDRSVDVDLIVKELLHRQVKLDKVHSDQVMATNDDVPEQIEAKTTKCGESKEFFLVE